MAGPENVIENDEVALARLIRRDQLLGLRQNLRAAIPINIVISAMVVLVAVHYQHIVSGLLWFAAATSINIIRASQKWLPVPMGSSPQDQRKVDWQLRLFSGTALIAGCIWAFIPVFSDYCSSPHSAFYLAVMCGITAGAITHGPSYALSPRCFITPPLLSVFSCLLYRGGFDHNALAVTVLVYAGALLSIAGKNEAGYRETSRLKNIAVALAQSLRDAHSSAVIAANQMEFRAEHDGLTGLLNRTGFMQAVQRRLADEKTAFCMIHLDLDGFKSVNDVYGHHAGDHVLIEVARRLLEALSERFIIGRLGGDEFAIFYDTSVVDAYPAEIATRLVTSIEVPFPSFDVGRLSACIGVYVGRGRDAAEMLTYADEALYTAKDAGRNRYYIFDEILRERSQMRRDVERDLQRALSENEIEIWYQPIISQKTEQVVSLEALLRWKHPKHGPIPPNEVIMVAAMSELAEALLCYVFKQVCAVLVELSALALKNVPVAINISPREISRLPIDEILLAGLEDSGLSPAMLEIEITEETALDIRSVQDKLIRLSQAGVKIAVDDFGVGYSSLATLRQPYIGKLKIDNSFVRGIAGSTENQILVQAILNLGRSLNVQVVAEGVEKVEDLDWLGQNGGDLVQGYYLRRPGSRKSVIDWLQEQRV